ncbi:MAG: hypothetical protein ABF912_13145 [Lacticaseibacillus paracasei]
MSNETKRDVFDEVRYKFRNFKNEHRHGMYVSPDSVDHYLSDALKRYYVALPDDLPVIPKAVGEYITWCKGTGGIGNVSDAMDYAHGDVAAWLYDERNSDDFARAWLLEAWIVEETGEVVQL